MRKAGAVAEAARMATFQAHAATHDDLTRLANRRHLLDYGARRGAPAIGPAQSAPNGPRAPPTPT